MALLRREEASLQALGAGTGRGALLGWPRIRSLKLWGWALGAGAEGMSRGWGALRLTGVRRGWTGRTAAERRGRDAGRAPLPRAPLLREHVQLSRWGGRGLAPRKLFAPTPWPAALSPRARCRWWACRRRPSSRPPPPAAACSPPRAPGRGAGPGRAGRARPARAGALRFRGTAAPRMGGRARRTIRPTADLLTAGSLMGPRAGAAGWQGLANPKPAPNPHARHAPSPPFWRSSPPFAPTSRRASTP
jgi:hypothetical protein